MLDVIYEDNHLFVVNKPPGLLTQASGTDQDSLENHAKLWIKKHANKSGNVFLHAVHRLDKPVSGIVLFARTSKALTRLNASMRDKRTRKVYLTIVSGAFSETEGFLEHYLIHDDYQARIGKSSDEGAKLARLHYRVLICQHGLSLLEIILETGRYHQIRAQMAASGHPIIGDRKYGSSYPYMAEGIALQHYHLEIAHPISGEMVTFEAPLALMLPSNGASSSSFPLGIRS